jgi:hypothetical protein
MNLHHERDTMPSTFLKIFYVSRCAASVTPTMVRSIVGTSQMRNRRADITGVLAYTGGHFAQALEGDAARVESLMQAISSDPRHESVRVLTRVPEADGRPDSRDFQGWSMHLLDSPELDDSIEALVGGDDGGDAQSASRTLERIAEIARYDASGDLGPAPGTGPSRP